MLTTTNENEKVKKETQELWIPAGTVTNTPINFTVSWAPSENSRPLVSTIGALTCGNLTLPRLWQSQDKCHSFMAPSVNQPQVLCGTKIQVSAIRWQVSSKNVFTLLGQWKIQGKCNGVMCSQRKLYSVPTTGTLWYQQRSECSSVARVLRVLWRVQQSNCVPKPAP